MCQTLVCQRADGEIASPDFSGIIGNRGSFREHWRQMPGVTIQAVERFDQYWDFENNRPATKHRTAAVKLRPGPPPCSRHNTPQHTTARAHTHVQPHTTQTRPQRRLTGGAAVVFQVGGKKAPSWDAMEQSKKIGSSFASLLDELGVPEDDRPRMVKSMSAAQKKAMVAQHARPASAAAVGSRAGGKKGGGRGRPSSSGSVRSSSSVSVQRHALPSLLSFALPWHALHAVFRHGAATQAKTPCGKIKSLP